MYTRRVFASIVVSAEHASANVPPELGGLGLDEVHLASHVAWDPGVRQVAAHLAEALNAPLFLGEHSRLVADLNRSPTSPECVPEIAFGLPIPGNFGLTAEERRARIARYHAPYWDAVRRAIELRLGAGPLLHFSVHSFTGELHGKRRELDLGLLFDPVRPLEEALARAMLPVLRELGFDTRNNEPYDGRADALVTANRSLYASDVYCGFELEISHDLLDRIDEVARAVERALRPCLR